MLKTLIVDDEPIARNILREELSAFADVVVIGEAQDGEQALRQIAELKPDVVFLDLQMPVMGGFEVVRKLGGGEYLPVIVIVTAFDQYAIDAFDAGAVDYLLKPVREQRLREAVQRAAKLRHRPLEVARDAARIASIGTQRKIVGRHGGDYFLLDTDDVLAFQADGELVWVITADQRLLATQPLRSLEEKLHQQPFQRIHRNAIVNVNHVRRMAAMSSQRWTITLSNGLEIVASKRRARDIRKLLRW